MIVRELVTALGFELDETQLNRSNQAFKSFEDRAKNLSASFAKIGGVLTAAVTVPFAGFLAMGIKGITEETAVLRQLENALINVGESAAFSMQELVAESKRLMAVSTFEDDDIIKGVTIQLLGLKGLTREAFAEAQQATVDLAAKFDMDLSSAAQTVARALSAPEGAARSLARAKIYLTDKEEETIKVLTESGQTAKAQTMILGILTNSVKGSALAATEGMGAWKQLTNEFKELADEFAVFVMPALEAGIKILRGMVKFIKDLSPPFKFFILILGGVAAAIGPILLALAGLLALLPSIVAGIGTLKLVFTALSGAALPALLPIILAMAKIAAVVTAVVLVFEDLYQYFTGGKSLIIPGLIKTFDYLSTSISKAWQWVKTFFTEITSKNWILDKLAKGIGIVGRFTGLSGDSDRRPAVSARQLGSGTTSSSSNTKMENSFKFEIDARGMSPAQVQDATSRGVQSGLSHTLLQAEQNTYSGGG